MNLKSLVLLFAVLLALPVSTASAQIRSGQTIRISISGVPLEEKSKIDGDYPVGQNGVISMPLLSGGIRAAGLQPESLAAVLRERYKGAGIYRECTFQVFSTAGGSTVVEEKVFVGGGVRNTGPVKYTRGLTVYQAIQAAGGATEFGSMKRVKILRDGKQRQYDLTQLQFMQIPLEPDDTVEVPQKTMFGN